MTGTLPSIPLQQNIDENGLPQSGCRLFLYEANTSTPVISYKDFLLTPGAEHSWPITADAMGRIPMFFVPDGFYRARLEERDGAPIYDEPQLPALSTGDGVGGGGGDPTAVTQWATGDFIWQPVAGVRDGWVRANSRTLGNAVSGASERAHADCANLYAFLWNNFPDLWCPVLGGRGPNGPSDFNNNKQIIIFDMRGFGAMGLAGMGNTVTERYNFVDIIRDGGYDQPGTWVGNNAQVMRVDQMPYHAHSAHTSVGVSLADPGHTHVVPQVAHAAIGPNVVAGAGWEIQDVAVSQSSTGVYVSAATGTTAIDPAGGNAMMNNVSYSALGTWYIKLSLMLPLLLPNLMNIIP